MLLEVTRAPFDVNEVRARLDVRDLHPFTASSSDPALFELLDFCIALYAVDRSLRRPTDGWSRRFVLEYPVHNLALWRRHAPLIREWLRALTGDDVIVKPMSRALTGVHHRREPALPLDDGADVVGLLSDGLDSLCGVDAAVRNPSQRLALASVITNPLRRKRIAGVVNFIHGVSPLIAHHTITTKLYQQRKVKEKTQRSRTVLAIALGMTVASALGAGVVESYENGYGILNPPIPDMQYGSMSSQVLQPSHLPLWDQISRAFFDRTIQLEFPNRFRTKAEMVRDLSREATHLVAATQSCDAQFRKKRIGLLHCGTCGSCRFRQLALAQSGRHITDTRYADQRMNDEPDAVARFVYHAALLEQALEQANPWDAVIRLQPEMRGVPYSDDDRLKAQSMQERLACQHDLREGTLDLLGRHVREVKAWAAHAA